MDILILSPIVTGVLGILGILNTANFMMFIIVPMREKPTENTNHKTVLTKNFRLKRVSIGRKIPQKTLLISHNESVN